MAFIKFKWVKDDREDKVLYQTKLSNNKKKRKGKNDFVLDWESSLGWSDNPFKDEILIPPNNFIAGREKEKKKLNLFFIHGNRFGTLKGSEGQGKSFLLKWLADELINYQNKYIVCYLPSKELKYDEFLKSIAKPFSSVFKSVKLSSQNVFSLVKEKLSSNKELVLLIDDIEEVSNEHMDLIKNLYGSMKNVNLIFSMSKNVDLSYFGNDELGIVLKDMDIDALKNMIKKRIENVGGIEIEPISNVQLKTLVKRAANNPRKLLEICNKKAIELSLEKKDNFFEDEVFESEDMKKLEADLESRKSSYSYDNTVDVDEIPLEQDKTVLEGDKIIQEILQADESIKKAINEKKKSTKKTAKKKK